jgi:undecaprenyl-diphosphatase
MTTLQAIIIAIVEGITEFLPISSTGHMIITSALMGIETNEVVKLFNVCIQLGAILAVVVLYYKRFLKSLDFYYKLAVAFIPAAIAGLLLKHFIKQLLESVSTVGVTLLFGGIVLLFIDKIFRRNDDKEILITYPNAFIIGCFQVLAMIPGVSRSAATIIGGMSRGLSRKQAAEFSFFLAVPTMFAATALDLLDNYTLINGENIKLLLIGNLVAFIVAMLAIKTFISILTRFGFFWFGIYRIVVGVAILTAMALGVNLHLV